MAGGMEKEKPEDDPLESLEPIRQSIRRICAQDQFTWEQSWKSVLTDVNQVRRGLLLPDVFQQTLELNEIRLTKKAFHALVEQFQLPNGAVQAHKFLQWIDLSRPSDHIDPELAFARLPQPYRRILKVLEQDILDAAWEKIKATSAKFKAETSAALSARSARVSLLSLQPNDDAAGCLDDYDVAKKRCCKTFKELPMPTPEPHNVALVMMTKHWRLPFLAVVWRKASEDAADHLLLQLVDTEKQKAITCVRVGPTPVAAVESSSDGSDIRVIGMTQLCCREDESSSSDRVLLAALHLRMTPKALEGSSEDSAPSAVSSVIVYEFTIPLQRTEERPPNARLVSSISFDNPSVSSVTAVEFSSDASLLAVSTTTCETLVYELLPSPPQDPSSEASEQTLPPQQPPLLLATLVTDSPATASYLLATPATDFQQHKHAKPYAIALVAGHTLSKFLLPTSKAAVAAPLQASWSHLSPVASSCIDPSSKYLTLGLEDGLIVVWNVVEDRDHVMLAPAKAGAAINQVSFNGDRIIVAFSQQAQQLFFYDISHRAAPQLVRVVTSPPVAAKQQQEAGSLVNPTRIVSISSQSTWLDVPVVLVEYSNGYCMAYDAQVGEAMASFRIMKTDTQSANASLPHLTALGNDSVIAVLPSTGHHTSPCLGLFDWSDLLKAAFPALETALASKGLQATPTNLKRMFLASSDGPGDKLTISMGAKASLHSLLLASTGHHSSKSSVLSGFHQSQSLGESKSSSTLTRASNADSRTSLASTESVQSQPFASQLPELPHIATYPCVPSISARFSQYCEEEKLLVARSDQDTKLQRRRNELIKILTAAW